jgi:hypothetical protein
MHRLILLARAASIATLLLALIAGGVAAADWDLVRDQGVDLHFVVVANDKLKDRSVYDAAALAICGPSASRICTVSFFDAREYVPKTGSDITDEQFAHVVGEYSRNLNTKFDQLLFACKIVAGDKCF